ncbi:MAG: hypothetical protein ACOH5I_05995 [Oligoflexus sp.]
MKNRKMMRPKSPSHLREDALADLYETPSFLPPLWRVIYQEAMRGHDILFPQNTLIDESGLAPLAEQQEIQISDVSCQLMAASDLSEMRRLIGQLQPPQRITLKKVLLHTFDRWQHSHRQSLH